MTTGGRGFLFALSGVFGNSGFLAVGGASLVTFGLVVPLAPFTSVTPTVFATSLDLIDFFPKDLGYLTAFEFFALPFSGSCEILPKVLESKRHTS